MVYFQAGPVCNFLVPKLEDWDISAVNPAAIWEKGTILVFVFRLRFAPKHNQLVLFLNIVKSA